MTDDPINDARTLTDGELLQALTNINSSIVSLSVIVLEFVTPLFDERKRVVLQQLSDVVAAIEKVQQSVKRAEDLYLGVP